VTGPVQLAVDFSRYPAYSPEELWVLMLPEERYRELLEQEQAEADRKARPEG
jgi:hypothetical protein